MVNCSVIDVINEIDRERDILLRADFLEFEFSDARHKHNMHDVSFGTLISTSIISNSWREYGHQERKQALAFGKTNKDA